MADPRTPLQELQALGASAMDAMVAESKHRLELQAAILESLPDAKVVVDDSGKIVLVNQQTEFMFGYHRSELIGQRVEMLLPARLREVHTSHRQGYSNEPRTRSMGAELTLFGLRKGGNEFPIEIMLAPIVISSGSYTIAVIRRKSASAAAQASPLIR
jgi:PAS domain S-box-containing protein